MSNAGRPSKMTQNLLNAIAMVLEHESSVIMTDEELLILINKELEPKERISTQAFKRYKANKDIKTVDSELYAQFLDLIKEARVFQKRNLYTNITASTNFFPYGWIGERKFKDLSKDYSNEPPKQVEVVNFKFTEKK